MKKLVEIEYWDYMDTCPRTEVRVFEGSDEKNLEKNVNDFVAHMKSHWCSGTTRLVSILNKEDAFTWLGQQITAEHCNWQDDSEEFISKISNLYKECYGEDAEDHFHQLDMADDYAAREL